MLFSDPNPVEPFCNRELAATLFGETEELMEMRVREFREALKREGIDVPDYDHINRKFLRRDQIQS